MANDIRWADAQRLEGWAGEVRLNLIRLVALAAFYGHHLVNVYLIQQDPSLRGAYHAGVTSLVLVWVLMVALLHLCLARRWVPPALKYVVTGCDLVLLTALLALPGNGPRSPLLVLYLLVIVAAALRLSLPLVYATTLGSMASYLIVLGCYIFIQVGAARYYAAGSPERIPRTHEIMFLLALGVAGLLAGQMVRQAQRLVKGYPVTVVEPDEKQA